VRLASACYCAVLCRSYSTAQYCTVAIIGAVLISSVTAPRPFYCEPRLQKTGRQPSWAVCFRGCSGWPRSRTWSGAAPSATVLLQPSGEIPIAQHRIESKRSASQIKVFRAGCCAIENACGRFGRTTFTSELFPVGPTDLTNYLFGAVRGGRSLSLLCCRFPTVRVSQ